MGFKKFKNYADIWLLMGRVEKGYPMSDILIVDDEPAMVRMLQKMLKSNGYSCETASNASDAKGLLAACAFKLMISDVRMPGESGLDLVRSISNKYPRLAIVIMTAEHDSQIAHAFLEAGIYGYILKPYSIHQMLITIHNALIRRELEIKAAQMRDNLEETIRERTTTLRTTLHDLEKQRAKAADAVRQSQDQLLFMQTLIEAIPNPVFYKDKEGKYLGCNRAFEQCLGITRKDFVGKTVDELIPDESAAPHTQADDLIFETGEKQVHESQIRYADGTMHDVQFYKAAYKNTEGQIDGLVGVMIDVTERKKQENALRKSKQRLHQILDNVGIGIALIDPDMRIQEVNLKMKEWFPHIENALRCYEIFHKPARLEPCAGCPAQKTLLDGTINETIESADAVNGPRTYRMVTTPIHDDNNEVIAIVKLMDDITDKLNMERELMQAQKMASIGQLSAGVAHEINNPTGYVSSNLTTLGGYADDLGQLIDNYQELLKALKSAAPASVPESVIALVNTITAFEEEIEIDYIRNDLSTVINDCRGGTDRIKKIVDDLKHFAHPGQNKVQDTDINHELETTLNVVHNELKYKASVIKELGDLPLIRANPQQLNQVFVNILVNAAQAIEKKGEIRIKTKCSNGQVVIQFSDTGHGIAPENIDKIFDPFFTTKEVGKGTGLGMNIVYNIVKRHFGTIDVESKIGEGTTFTIKLPINISDLSDAA